MQPDDLRALPAILDALCPRAGAVTTEDLDLDRADIGSSAPLWAGPFAVDDLAVSCVTAALMAAAALAADRNGRVVRVELDGEHAAAAFQIEGLVEPIGWEVPPVWDPIAGDYPCADGWVRLHTNYPHHRTAALAALGIQDRPDLSRADVEAAVSTSPAAQIEDAVVAAGGVAAVQRTPADWAAHPAATARHEPLLGHDECPARHRRLPPADRPFDGVRVVDLTRVLAGPTTTGFLAAWGADVLRIDPVGFPEVPALLPITTAGKRCAALDLRTAEGRRHLDALVSDADVVVHGYRRDALDSIGVDTEAWHRDGGLIEVTLDAYGWNGPWADRRGFDSIVQHSVGITTVGQQVRGADRPVPLPCQALDHGAGWLLAAAVGAGLLGRQRDGRGSTWKTSLARVAELLMSLPHDDPVQRPAATLDRLVRHSVVAPTKWGPLRRIAWPGRIDAQQPIMGSAGPIGTSPPAW